MTDKVIRTDINTHFKLPIYYNKHTAKLNTNITSDLELVFNNKDNNTDTDAKSVYNHCFTHVNPLFEMLNDQFSKLYTTDVTFLKDSQQLLKTFNTKQLNKYHVSPFRKRNPNKMIDVMKELFECPNFKEKFYYLEWAQLEFLNKSEVFLQVFSMYNTLSPLISLLVPFIILIIPFFIIQIKGLQLNLCEYGTVLKQVARQNAIGKLCVANFTELSGQEIMYMLISAGFYIMSIYQNFNVCSKFITNMQVIYRQLTEIKKYALNCIDSYNHFLLYSSELSTYEPFNEILMQHKQHMTELCQDINNIHLIPPSDFASGNFMIAIPQIGKVLKLYYELYTNPIYYQTFTYSLGFNGYINCLFDLQTLLGEKKLNFATYTTKSKKTVFKNSYYACLLDNNNNNNTEIKETPVKNTIALNKNISITGPNASGKTTMLKSTLINIIFSQQFGCGFYDSAKIKPFNHIHCYLNIPDTSGRDSLFQAEARRCKDMLDIISSSNKKDTHFCAFDELYSGTNPEDAEQSAVSFMRYMTTLPNVSCILTTHFINVCKKLERTGDIVNYKMGTTLIDDKLIYSYKMFKGLSDIKGGMNVLKQMKYPIEIVNGSLILD